MFFKFSFVSILFINYVVQSSVISGPETSVDRSLHVRSLPPISGFQSNIYEVYMEPYGFKLGPILASAVIRPKGGNVVGGKQDSNLGIMVKGDLAIIQLEPPYGPVQIVGNITGLPPGSHGFHIHQFGDVREGCTSAGEHFNPLNAPHGGKHDLIRHIGDLGNIIADKDGKAEVNLVDHYLTLFSSPYQIIGRAIVVHEHLDDSGRGGTSESKMSGSSGNRLACGVIAYAN